MKLLQQRLLLNTASHLLIGTLAPHICVALFHLYYLPLGNVLTKAENAERVLLEK